MIQQAKKGSEKPVIPKIRRGNDVMLTITVKDYDLSSATGVHLTIETHPMETPIVGGEMKAEFFYL